MSGLKSRFSCFVIDRPISGHASASAINIASAIITKVILDTSFMLKNSSFAISGYEILEAWSNVILSKNFLASNPI
jgi:hypothetical protein